MVQHWKHGWIPISPEAKAFVAGKGPNPTPGHWTKPGPRGAPSSHTRVLVGQQGTTIPKPVVRRLGQANLQEAIAKDGGFTYDPSTGGLLKVGEAKGFAIAVPGTEEIVGNGEVTRDAFAKGVAKVLMKHRDKIGQGAVLGGWYSPDRNQYMVELTEIFPPSDRDGAIRVGKARNQEAIFDLATGETINTGGTGDAGLKEVA